MASRIVVAQQSAARRSKQRDGRSASALEPAGQQKTPQPHTPVPFDFGGVRPLAAGEQLSSQLPQANGPVPLPWPIQARLQVGAVNDPLEREADQVADRIMQMPAPASVSSSASGEVVRRKCQSCGDEENQKRTVLRKCQSCSEEEEKSKKEEATPDKLSRKETGRPAAVDGPATPAMAGEVICSPGQPLDPATRAFFEPRFGYDFSRVRIHNDAPASAAAHAVNALAYTVGKDVVFGAAQFAPDTTKGLHLLAHELTHVIQQSDRPNATRTPTNPVPRRSAEAVVQRQSEVRFDQNATCNPGQREKIDHAAFKAIEWLSRAIPPIEAFLSGARTRQAQAARAALSKHFHSLDSAVVGYVRDRLKTIQSDILGRQNFRVNCPPASDSACRRVREGGENVAVVPAGNPNELDFCAPFFKRNVEDCASTIIHEFGHAQLGLSVRQQMDDRGYQGDAYYWYLTTGEALTNAESYAMLAREVATGFSPAQGFISDSLEDCPAGWIPLISDAITKARMWNHSAAINYPDRHEFSRAYRTLDVKLQSDFTLNCRPDGGGDCQGNRNLGYWHWWGELHICPGLIRLSPPDERAISLLAVLYAYESLVDGDERQNTAAREARRIHSANVPSTADVLSGR
jgi:Domain of unknown function (DUF4157)/Lysine-specific metallo-endopeptidase